MRLALRGGRRHRHRALVMGILNATPDSFSDGGELSGEGALEARVREMLDAGADILDVGGESTRPGHAPVRAEEEKRRVLPVIEAVRSASQDVPISIDTRKASVAAAALAAGADIVNDVSGLGDRRMARVLVDADCPVVLMRHRDLGTDVLESCRDELARITARAVSAGVAEDAIIIDPGLGFGTPPGPDPDANMALLQGIPAYSQGYPVLVGASRKRFLGTLSGEAGPKRRVGASVAAAILAAQAGAAIVRVHDVRETVQAMRVCGM